MVTASRASRGTFPLRFTTPDHHHLRTSLLQASRRASQYRRSIVVCLVQAVEDCNAIDMFACFQQCAPGECFFWSQPSTQTVFVGCGSSTKIETRGATRFSAAATAWDTLLEHAVIDDIPSGMRTRFPFLFGGFSFDAQRPATSLWEGFPPGLFILPRLLFLQEDKRAVLAISALIQPGDDIEQHYKSIQALLGRLQAALTDYPGIGPEIDFSRCMTLRDLRAASEWKRLVGQVGQQIRAGVYEKVVLARGVTVALDARTETTFDASEVLTRLAQNYPSSYIFALQRGAQCFTGATPECLVRIRDGQIYTMALAGTAPRGTNALEDEQIGAELLASGKNQKEHHSVVKMIQETLQHFCSQVYREDQQHLVKLQNVQHLMTPITGELLSGYTILEIVARLHPTPAVGGLPGQAALQVIREREALDRGWYAGPIGWIDASGNGEFAVALRSGLLRGREATLFAGCGIVADSDPQSEYLESCLKLKVMLRGLGYES